MNKDFFEKLKNQVEHNSAIPSELYDWPQCQKED